MVLVMPWLQQTSKPSPSRLKGTAKPAPVTLQGFYFSFKTYFFPHQLQGEAFWRQQGQCGKGKPHRAEASPRGGVGGEGGGEGGISCDEQL